METAMTSVEWPGRLQRLTEGDLIGLAPEGAEIWLDGGHNPGAGEVIAEAMAGFEERQPRPLYLIIGMLNTKDRWGISVPLRILPNMSSPCRFAAARPVSIPLSWPMPPMMRALWRNQLRRSRKR